MSLAHEPVRRVADSGAEAQEALGGGHEWQRRAVENGHDGRDKLGVRFKRVPVAPILPCKIGEGMQNPSRGFTTSAVGRRETRPRCGAAAEGPRAMGIARSKSLRPDFALQNGRRD